MKRLIIVLVIILGSCSEDSMDIPDLLWDFKVEVFTVRKEYKVSQGIQSTYNTIRNSRVLVDVHNIPRSQYYNLKGQYQNKTDVVVEDKGGDLGVETTTTYKVTSKSH